MVLHTIAGVHAALKDLARTGKPPGFQGNPGGSVEMGGIEPPSSGRPRVLLRAQSANNFSAPGVMQTCYRMGSVD